MRRGEGGRSRRDEWRQEGRDSLSRNNMAAKRPYHRDSGKHLLFFITASGRERERMGRERIKNGREADLVLEEEMGGEGEGVADARDGGHELGAGAEVANGAEVLEGMGLVGEGVGGGIRATLEADLDGLELNLAEDDEKEKERKKRSGGKI